MSHSETPISLLLQDRIILVTGASEGIGRTIAKAYAAQGATVILLARSVPKLESLYDEIEGAGYPKPAIYPMNLANATPTDYEALRDNIDRYFGRLDGVLFNAAFLGSLTPIEHYPIEQWYQVLQINLNSPFLLTHAVLPLLKRSKEASILFTSCEVGHKAKAYWGAYAVSKFGCEGLMQVLADELETNTSIRVNSINPGIIKTRLRRNAYPGENPEHLTSPEELIPTYLYLMGPHSREVNGQCFTFTHKNPLNCET